MTGQELIDKWIAFFRRYVVMTEGQALVVALWAINTWVYDHFPAVPFLEIAASTKRSGKTTLLDALKLTTRGAEKFAIVRILTVLRMVEAFEGKITVLIDEAEQFSKPSLGEVRSGVATGYKSGAQHAVSVGKGFQRFRTFAPWAFAQIGNVHGVLRDRCIELELQRGTPERMLSEHETAAKAEAQELIAALVAFSGEYARKHGGKLHIPVVAADWLTGRERELWTPLVSVAAWIGVHVDTMRALQSASVDMGLLKTKPPMVWHSAQDERDEEDREMAERALHDALSVVKPGEVVITSEELVERMRAIPIAPWRAWRAHGLNAILLAALLARYAVAPEKVQIGSGRKERKLLQGYKVKALQDAAKK